MQRSSSRLVLVKEIADEEQHVDFMVSRELEDFPECLYGISPSHRVSFIVADVVIGRY